MSVERIYVGDERVYVPRVGQWVEQGSQVEFDEDPESPLFATPAEAKKALSKRPVKHDPPEPASPGEPSKSEED